MAWANKRFKVVVCQQTERWQNGAEDVFLSVLYSSLHSDNFSGVDERPNWT